MADGVYVGYILQYGLINSSLTILIGYKYK